MVQNKLGRQSCLDEEILGGRQIGPELITDMQKIAKKNRRSENSEYVVAIEVYVESWNKDWRNKY